MAVTAAAPDDEVTSALWNQLAGLVNGTTGFGNPVVLTQLSSDSFWALTARNQGSLGQGFRVQNAAGSGNLLTVAESQTTFGNVVVMASSLTVNGTLATTALQMAAPLTMLKATSIAAPAATLSALYPKTDERWYKQTSAGDEVLLLDTDLFTAAGDTLYFSADETPARLALGTKGYAVLAGASAPLYEPIQRRNRFLNGDMRVKQRAVMPTADNSYALDGLRLELGAANAATISQDTATVPSGGSGYACKLTVGSGNNNKFGIFLPLANHEILDLRGGVVSVQMKAIATAGLSDIRWALLQRTSGTADGSATAPNALVDPITTWGSGGAGITTYADNWTQINTPGNLGVGTSFGSTIFKLENQSVSASALNLALFIWNDDTTTTQTTDTLSVTDVQLEKGAICADIERKPYADQVSACQFWLQVTPGARYPFQSVGSASSTTNADFGPLVRRRMRVGPTLSVTAADWASVQGGSVFPFSALTLLYAQPDGVWLQGTATGLTTLAPQALSSSTAGSLTDLILTAEL